MMPSPRLELLSDFRPCDVLESNSTRFVYGEESEETATTLPLFEAVPIFVTKTEGWSFVVDSVLYGGGLCNTLDWCPKDPLQDGSVEYLALSCHSKHEQRNQIGSVLSGSGVVQIWSVEAGCEDFRWSMRMSMGIVHDGAVCSYLQWCPDPSVLLSVSQLTYGPMGLLAMALGDGNMCIVPVPRPSYERVFVRIEPWVKVTKEDLSGSLVSCLDWHPVSPHELLLLGCWDGTVSIWALPCRERKEAEQLSQHRVDLLAMRRVVWLKPPKGHITDTESVLADCFCTAGHSGHFTIWSRNNMLQPLLEWSLTRWWIQDVDVTGDPLGAYLAFEDATIRQLPLEMEGFTDQLDQPVFHVYSGTNKGAFHAICCSPCNALVAYGGEDGEIAVFAKENVGDARYRKPHVCAGSMKYDSGTSLLHVYTASQCRKIGGVYIGGAKFASNTPKGEAQEADVIGCAFEHQTIQCLKFSPNGNATTWLAAGCANGFIRIVRITE